MKPARQTMATDTGHQAALEIVEGARETEWQHPSFVAELFMGRLRTDLLFPYPEQPAIDRQHGDAFLAQLVPFLRQSLDAEAVDRTGELPQTVIDGLARLGCFGLKIPTEYGGLGFSQTNYDRIIQLIASHCTSTAVWLSAHQSIGVPQPLTMFGTPAQKQKFLPQLARGKISAFALTEPEVGSDPAKMKTTATPTDDGRAFLLNGEKLWCTNGPVADFIVVVACTPPKIVGGKEKRQLTAFIVEKDMPGLTISHRCEFMGLKGIQNGVLQFTNVRVPRENIIWEEGRGLKVALMTLNTGRLTLPASCLGAAKRCLEICRRWVTTREQWGVPVGKHEAIGVRLARMTATTFAMEAVAYLACALVDRGNYDIRLEAAMAKMFCTEATWDLINDAMQIKGGRGYETATSLQARGEAPDPIERIMRDCRINTIFEGSSEIMRLFIAREALDGHLQIAGALFDPKAGWGAKLKAVGRMCGFYSCWYPQQWLFAYGRGEPRAHRRLQGHMRFVRRRTHALARALFHAMGRYGPKLERRQMVLWRAVDIGTDLFAMTAAVAYASRPGAEPQGVELADYFCREARRRVRANLRHFASPDDARAVRLTRQFMAGDLSWLEAGIVPST